ncbi:MAG: helix-turn-helix transcriptional regulator [Intrasporangium sp.]|uniref:helix-turn-helix transcriptional regulator n=1 Tax=Intrasporangium sp. TaxID=1925024 RepID=UPI0026476EB2|nr:helix-turn-helix transcriptional regulator [Intrasporangium sp.]MDN5797067.1 helix-turn-helix transcriptional regulator [Intrasporangium sp.]
MWEARADRARKDIAALAATGLGVTDLHAAAIRMVADDVGADLACWACIDPENLIISSMTSGDSSIPPEYEPLLAEAEYSGEDPHSFAALARHHTGAVRLSELSRTQREHSARLQTVWRPLGLEHELRVMFVADGACWGAAGMVRSGPNFTDREVELLLGVAPVIAAATRLAVRSEVTAATRGAVGGRAAIVVAGGEGQLCSATPAAREWQELLDAYAPGRFQTMMRIMTLGSRAAGSAGFRARLRDPHGRWAILEASQLDGPGEKQTAISIELASGERLLGLLLTAYGLTTREQEVSRHVIAGRSTAEIAERLFISANTVQDHLKSVFAKVGAHRRGELVARLRPESSATADPPSSAVQVLPPPPSGRTPPLRA